MQDARTRAMRRTRSIARAIIAAATMMAGAAAHAGDPAALRAATLAAGCAACHGTAGRAAPQSAMPALAGMSAERVRDAMKAFRSDQRPGTVMPQLSKGYSDEQIDRLATFFAAQPEAQ